MRSRVGRAVRDSLTPDLPGQVEERLRRRAAGERAHDEMLVRFGGLTPQNAHEAVTWQERRIAELTGAETTDNTTTAGD